MIIILCKIITKSIILSNNILKVESKYNVVNYLIYRLIKFSLNSKLHGYILIILYYIKEIINRRYHTKTNYFKAEYINIYSLFIFTSLLLKHSNMKD